MISVVFVYPLCSWYMLTYFTNQSLPPPKLLPHFVHDSGLNMVTGLQHLIVICFAMIHIFALLANYIINLANGQSFSQLPKAFKKLGLDSWDTTAVFIWIVSQILLPPLTLYFVNSLRKTLGKFASEYNAKLQNLVSAGKGVSSTTSTWQNM